MEKNGGRMNPKRVGILGFEEIMALDLVGPADAFTTAVTNGEDGGHQPGYEVLIIGLTNKPFVSESGVLFKPHKTIQDAPALDTLIIPGGRGLRKPKTSAKMSAW